MEITTEPQTLEATLENTEASSRRMLILEDDPALRRILWRTFASWGWSAVAAASVEEAKLFAAGTTTYDLIVSDYHVPDGTGLDLMRWVQEQTGFIPPFILMSADPRVPFHSQARRLQKPFSIDELRAMVRLAIGVNTPQSRTLRADTST